MVYVYRVKKRERGMANEIRTFGRARRAVTRYTSVFTARDSRTENSRKSPSI